MKPLLSVDLETECAVPGCPGKRSCDHALIPHLARITVAAAYDGKEVVLFRGSTIAKQVGEFVQKGNFVLLGHNFKWDLKMLNYHGANIPVELYAHDTQILAHCCLTKIPDAWIEAYEFERKKRKGEGHREGTPLSLKTLAPFFLGVDKFWETENHDDDTYVSKDAIYPWQLLELLTNLCKEQGVYDFYQEKMMPWVRTLYEAETRGIKLNMDLLAKKEAEAVKRVGELKAQLDKMWAPAYIAYHDLEAKEVITRYSAMLHAQLAKKPKDPKKTEMRYLGLQQAALDKMQIGINLDSNQQLAWLLRDYLGLNLWTTNKKGEEVESTGVEVLEKYSNRPDIKLYLEYRGVQKLATAFFPTYRELQRDEILHCNFNITGTITGRLSSSNPNLQQVPGDLHQLFIARPGYKLVCRDESYVEPRFIAYYSEDPMLCELILRDGNFHSANAAIFHQLTCPEVEIKKLHPNERDHAKEVGLSILYGAGGKRLLLSGAKWGYHRSLEYWKNVVLNLREHYETVWEFKKQLDAEAIQRPIINFFGRKHWFEDPEDIYMKNFNKLIQGSASDLVVDSAHRAMQEFRAKNIDAHLLLLVHDESVFEVPETKVKECEEIIERNMTDYKLPTVYGNIPLKVEGKTGDAWAK
jgi:DNA polymerase I-like protein with 3'-5' exonuclease and polymerase domains